MGNATLNQLGLISQPVIERAFATAAHDALKVSQLCEEKQDIDVQNVVCYTDQFEEFGSAATTGHDQDGRRSGRQARREA